MEIDLNREQIISFAELAKSLPGRPSRKPIHLSTIHRWRKNGLRGVHLECVRIGGRWCTSREAFSRFCRRLTALEESPAATQVPRDQPKRTRKPKHTCEQLEREGW